MRVLAIFLVASALLALASAVMTNGKDTAGQFTSSGYQYPRPTSAPLPRPTEQPQHNSGYRYGTPQRPQVPIPQLPQYPAYYQQTVQPPAAAIDASGLGQQAFPQNTPEYFVPNAQNADRAVTPTHTLAYFVQSQPAPTKPVEATQNPENSLAGNYYQQNYQNSDNFEARREEQRGQQGFDSNRSGAQPNGAQGAFLNGPSNTRPTAASPFDSMYPVATVTNPFASSASSAGPQASSTFSESSFSRPLAANPTSSTSSSSVGTSHTPTATSHTYSMTQNAQQAPSQPTYSGPSSWNSFPSSQSYPSPTKAPAYSRPSASNAYASSSSSAASTSSQTSNSASFAAQNTFPTPSGPQSARSELPPNHKHFPGQAAAFGAGQIGTPSAGHNGHPAHPIPPPANAEPARQPAFRPVATYPNHKPYYEAPLLTGEWSARPTGDYYMQMQSQSYEMPFMGGPTPNQYREGQQFPAPQHQQFPAPQQQQFPAPQHQQFAANEQQRPTPAASHPNAFNSMPAATYRPTFGAHNSQPAIEANYQSQQASSFNHQSRPVDSAQVNRYNQQQTAFAGGNGNDITPPSKLYLPPYYKK